MPIKVTLKSRSGGKEAELHGENVEVEGSVLKIWTEPHEIIPGGPVDLFVGDIVPLDTFSIAKVRRI